MNIFLNSSRIRWFCIAAQIFMKTIAINIFDGRIKKINKIKNFYFFLLILLMFGRNRLSG